MQFEILGPPRVMVDDDPLPLGSPQQQKLLALLLVSPNRAISTDRLVDELWRDDPPPSARHLVQVYVSRLRNLLGSDDEGSRISHQNDGYLVRVRPDDVDALSLSSRVRSARALLATDPAGAARELQAIVALRRGPPFGHLADDCPTLQAEAVRFEESHLEAVTCLAEARLELGHHAELIPELETLTRGHPYREQLWAHRMLALYRSGRQAEALRTYQQLSRVLGDDLGIEPSTEVRHLEERILLQDVGLLWELPPPPNNLPTPLTSFVGRDAEIAEIAKLVDTFRLTILSGPGGIGKTRLAIEVAQRLQLQFPDGIWWVDLAPVADPDGVEVALARVLGVTEQSGTALVDSLVRALLRREALVVMDNCEHLASAVADLFTALLREARGIRILATSRLPLHVPGEARWSVPSLSMPNVDELTTAALPAADAIGLFVDRGTAADPGFALTAENGADVIEICRQLDAMPLAIEMAAARVRALAPAQIVTALADRFDLLGQQDHGVDPRHQTLKGAIDWSYQLLEPRDRRAFERLSVFAGSFDLEAATAVARPGKSVPRMVDSITALLEASMLTTVRLEPSVIHYRMLETLRAYGARLLDERGETDRSRRRHSTYVLGLVTLAGEAIDTPGFASWVRRINVHHADLQQALGWSFEHQRGYLAMQAAPALFHYWFRTGDARDAGRWAGQMLEHPGDSPPELLAAAHLSAGFSGTILGDPDAAIAHSSAAAALYEKSGDKRGLIHALFGIAQGALQMGDFATAQERSEQALVVCDDLDDPWSRAGPLATLSFVLLFSGGSLDEARRLAEEARMLHHELGDVASQVVMNPLSLIAIRQGDFAAAERYAAEAVSIADGIAWEATALVNLAEVQMAMGHTRAAEESLQRGLTRALDTGLENWFRVALRDLAVVAQARGDANRTAILYGASRHKMPQWGLVPEVYEALDAAGRDALGDDRFTHLASEGSRLSYQQLLDLVFDSVADSDSASHLDR